MFKNHRPIKFFIVAIIGIATTHLGITWLDVKYLTAYLNETQQNFFDSFLIIVIVSPILYYFSLKPLLKKTREYELSEKFLSVSKSQMEQANEDLRKFKLAIDNTSERVIITDPNGIVLYCNPATEKITGYKPEEVIGEKAGTLWHLPMPREYYEKLWHTIRDKKETFRGELQNRRKNGEVYDAVTNISPVLDEKEEVLFFVEVENDITERKRAEEELRKSEARFRQVLDNMLEGCMIIGFDWTYIYLNDAAALHGRNKRENLINKAMPEMYPGIKKSAIFTHYQECMEERVPQHFEESYTFADGVTSWYTFSVEPVPEGIFVLSIDITKEKEMDKIKSDFLTIASHQLRTPLSGTRWLIETLNKPFIGKLNMKQKEYLDELYKVNAKMLDLVSDLLNLLRLESGDLAVSIKKFAVSKFSDDVLAMMENAAKNKGVILKGIPKEKRKITVNTDFQIVVNILESFVSNSIEYSRSGGEVSLDVEENKDSVILSVKDTGIGIPKDEQVRIFEKFYRASNAKSIRPGGTGLGLSIASILAQKIGAKLSFESQEGKGSIFYLKMKKGNV